MGIFGKNWAKEIARAEDLLARELPAPALEIAQRATDKAGPEFKRQASELATRARRALVASVLAKAEAAEAAGDLEDAADWLLAAIEHDPRASAELETRRRRLQESALDSDSALRIAEEVTIVDDGPEEVADLSLHYETLVTMFDDDETRALYEGRPAAFQQAFVDLNGGRAASAVVVLERLAAAAPDDPLLRLELGHARLLSGDEAAAKDDLAAAWTAFGDRLLDTTTSLSAPALWAEAALATDGAEEVIERLAPLAEPATGNRELQRLYATALITAERLTAAIDYLSDTLSRGPNDPELSLMLAQTLAANRQPADAISHLEQAIAPSCTSGGCSRPSRHLPSLRLLAGLHLAHGDQPQRARELLALIAHDQQGHLDAVDLTILADYYRATGDTAAADDAAAHAERLAPPSAGAEIADSGIG